MNYTKEEVCDIISSKTGAYIHYAEVGEDKDKRDYEVSYEKISNLGYSTTIGVPDGIDELLRAYEVIKVETKYTSLL